MDERGKPAKNSTASQLIELRPSLEIPIAGTKWKATSEWPLVNSHIILCHRYGGLPIHWAKVMVLFIGVWAFFWNFVGSSMSNFYRWGNGFTSEVREARGLRLFECLTEEEHVRRKERTQGVQQARLGNCARNEVFWLGSLRQLYWFHRKQSAHRKRSFVPC